MADQPLPNILWIGLDEQHRQTVGAYGSRNCKTPYIDGLASEGLVFDHAFSPIAVCAPARASMLTGKLPSEGSVISNNPMEWTVPFRDTTHEKPLTTWVPDLKDAGYRCVHGRQVARDARAGRQAKQIRIRRAGPGGRKIFAIIAPASVYQPSLNWKMNCPLNTRSSRPSLRSAPD